MQSTLARFSAKGSHPNGEYGHFRVTETQKNHLDVLPTWIIFWGGSKLKKLFFMAVDGVAQCAKINQQRFRTAKKALQV
jgi:hypothetical protein